jgi:hypothetical protein
MAEAAAAKEPKGHGVQADEGRPLKPRMMMERTMARSFDACESVSRCWLSNEEDAYLPERFERRRAAGGARGGTQA